MCALLVKSDVFNPAAGAKWSVKAQGRVAHNNIAGKRVGLSFLGKYIPSMSHGSQRQGDRACALILFNIEGTTEHHMHVLFFLSYSQDESSPSPFRNLILFLIIR